ncbi:MAG TPA: hypothetical protein VK072_07050 [Candidatus Avamphibacillus sp.]|nr:hypothetical protein [Candidatus Avamphibacillus sp.]
MSPDLVEYLDGKKGAVASDVADAMGEVSKHGITVGTLLKAYDLHQKVKLIIEC